MLRNSLLFQNVSTLCPSTTLLILDWASPCPCQACLFQSTSKQRLFFTKHSYSSTLRNNAIPFRWISPHIHFITCPCHCLTSPSNAVTTHFFAATWLCYATASLFYAIPCQCSTIQILNYALPYQGRTFLLLLLSVPLRKFASPLLSFASLFCAFPAPNMS